VSQLKTNTSPKYDNEIQYTLHVTCVVLLLMYIR
jgi:hypothetical protein